MKFQIHIQKDGFRFWPVGTVEAQDKAAPPQRSPRQFGEGRYVADVWSPPFAAEPGEVFRGVSLGRHSSLSSRR